MKAEITANKEESATNETKLGDERSRGLAPSKEMKRRIRSEYEWNKKIGQRGTESWDGESSRDACSLIQFDNKADFFFFSALFQVIRSEIEINKNWKMRLLTGKESAESRNSW